MRLAWVAVVALVAPNGCRHAGDVVDNAMQAAADRDVRHVLLHRSPIRVQFDPSIPSQIARGDKTPILLEARFESRETCRFCEATWVSSAPEIAVFSTSNPCGEGRCSAVLEGVAAGKAPLTVRVCQTRERDCRQWRFTLVVYE